MLNSFIRVAGLVLFLACLALIAAAGLVLLTGLPAYTQVDASQAFVYPAGGHLLIALPGGPYILRGELRDGCYRLTAPVPGETYGEATWARPECQ